jgi:hypothetical protein
MTAVRVGDVVLFHIRPGGLGYVVNNQNRPVRPALVLYVREGGNADLMVFYGFGPKGLDVDEHSDIPRQSEQQPVDSWSILR